MDQARGANLSSADGIYIEVIAISSPLLRGEEI
jgi:hypothetical protein